MSLLHLFLLAFIPGLVYAVAISIQRIFFSRLSHVPGPKLAAVSTLYQAYYDLFPRRGKFLFKCIELHKEHGPIIRIGPDEVHVNDPQRYDEMYGGLGSGRRNMSPLSFWINSTREFGNLSVSTTIDHDRHRMLMTTLNDYFGKGIVQYMEPRVKDKVLLLRKRLLEMGKTGKSVDLNDAFGALSLDIISMYCFGHAIGALDRPTLARKENELIRSGMFLLPFFRSFPTISRMMLKIPRKVASLVPLYREATAFIDTAQKLTRNAMKEAVEDDGKPRDPEAPPRTVIHSIIQSDILPTHKKTFKHLSANAATLLAGGMEPTSRVLTVGMYCLLTQEHIRAKLLRELRTVMPNSESEIPPVKILEKLPYLSAVIYESTRISHGAAGHLVRIALDEDLKRRDKDGKIISIPRGCTFSQSPYLVYTNEAIYPEPFTFNPDRYLKEGGGITNGQRYPVPFSKGTHMCVGVNLALSELYLTFAALIGSLSLEIVQATDEDAKIDADLFMGFLPGHDSGVRMKILGSL